MKRSIDEARRIAREQFGYERLNSGQEETILSVLKGRDTLTVMPTGGGKSAIYQIAAQFFPGPTIVVSPLLALQRDQATSIEGQEFGAADVLNSTESQGERQEVIEKFERGGNRFLFLAPEQFNNEEVLGRVRDTHPCLLVVDEAHCVSEWGHNFRPEYLRLGAVIDAIGHPCVLALTATASPPVRDEIVERLRMKDAARIVKGFDRPNIWLGVQRFEDERTQTNALLDAVVEAEKPGIVYVSTKRHAEGMDAGLGERGVKSIHYHAGMNAREREGAQERFMNDEAEVMVATIAFGMGVDKPNVRFVFHYDISDSIDAYYQEIGRAGRDDEPARAILFYRPRDLAIHHFFAGRGKVDEGEMQQAMEAIDANGPVCAEQVRDETGLSLSKVSTAVTRLADAGMIEILPTGAIVLREQHPHPEQAVKEALEAEGNHRAFERSRREMMRGYAELDDCRREYLLNYFGEDFNPPCHACDNCDAGVYREDNQDTRPFPLNTRVVHSAIGPGLIERYEGNKVVVLFDEVGYKTLDLDFVREQGLLASER